MQHFLIMGWVGLGFLMWLCPAQASSDRVYLGTGIVFPNDIQAVSINPGALSSTRPSAGISGQFSTSQVSDLFSGFSTSTQGGELGFGVGVDYVPTSKITTVEAGVGVGAGSSLRLGGSYTFYKYDTQTMISWLNAGARLGGKTGWAAGFYSSHVTSESRTVEAGIGYHGPNYYGELDASYSFSSKTTTATAALAFRLNRIVDASVIYYQPFSSSSSSTTTLGFSLHGDSAGLQLGYVLTYSQYTAGLVFGF